jgi:hypothetical protein
MIDELLKLLALIITPDWGALIVLLPLFIAPLVLLWFFATGGGWGLVALTKRRAQLKYADATPTPPQRDADGRPLVVYHGTSEKGLKQNAFEKAFLGSVSNALSAKAGFFFVKDRATAQGYSDWANQNPDMVREYKKRSVTEIPKWYVAKSIGFSVADITDEFYVAYKFSLKVRRLLKEMKK